jgi:hypothetical protein
MRRRGVKPTGMKKVIDEILKAVPAVTVTAPGAS